MEQHFFKLELPRGKRDFGWHSFHAWVDLSGFLNNVLWDLIGVFPYPLGIGGLNWVAS